MYCSTSSASKLRLVNVKRLAKCEAMQIDAKVVNLEHNWQVNNKLVKVPVACRWDFNHCRKVPCTYAP